MSIKIFLILISFISLFAQNNPTLYSSFANKLYDANTQFALFTNHELLSNHIHSYQIECDRLREIAFKLESKSNTTDIERNDYLASLRALEEIYIRIIHKLQHMLLKSIDLNDYDTFQQIANTPISDLWESHSLVSHAIEFYQKNKRKDTIGSLEKLIHDKNLEKVAVLMQEHRGSDVYIMKRNVKKNSVHTDQEYAPYVDQENAPVGSRGGLEITNNQTVAQSFSITKKGRLNALDLIDIRHHRCTPTKSLYVSLVNIENGKPGPHSYYTRELHPNEISLTTKLSFGSYGPIVKPGEQYAIYLKTDAGADGCTYAWGGDIETYHGGKTFINQIENTRDMKFRTYVQLIDFNK